MCVLLGASVCNLMGVIYIYTVFCVLMCIHIVQYTAAAAV